MTIDTTSRSVLNKKPTLFKLLKLCGLWLVLGVSTQTFALEFRCVIEGDTRHLQVDIPGNERLCEVAVNYLSSGERRVMWYADKETLFCSAKIYELKDKYEQEWNFECEQWPDLDGIDQLAPSNRRILDTQLKALIERGNISNPPFTVNRVKAVASNLFEKQVSKLALQFFLSNGDITQVIDTDGESWTLLSSIDNLASHISSDLPVSLALISAISDDGSLEVETTLDTNETQNCFGQQAFATLASDELAPLTQHRHICHNPAVSEK